MFLASCEVSPLIFGSKRASPYIDSTFPRGLTPEMYSRPPYGCAKFLTEPSKGKGKGPMIMVVRRRRGEAGLVRCYDYDYYYDYDYGCYINYIIPYNIITSGNA